MGRGQWWVFNVLYLAFTTVWVLVLVSVNLLSRVSWLAKALITLGLVVVTPTLEGPWFYRKYLKSWQEENKVTDEG